MDNYTQAVLKETLSMHGADAQIDKCIEEMSELTQALMKYRHAPYKGKQGYYGEEVAKEMADVLITLETLKLIFNKNIINETIDYKVERLDRRNISGRSESWLDEWLSNKS